MGGAGRPNFDAVVIGSGIGGLVAAAALSKRGRRVLVLERHDQLGGLTQTFERNGYRFATGVHYIGGLGDEPGAGGQFGRLLHWLSDGRLQFASIGSPYDIIRLPGFEFPVEAPRAAYVARLKAAFPAEATGIDGYFAACDEAQRASFALFATRALPPSIAALVRWLNVRRLHHALGMTTADAVRGFRDPRLAAVLSARWGDYGLEPSRSPFAVHALVTGSYFAGAYYPVGGPACFAEALGATVRSAGGELRTNAAVGAIEVDGGRVVGVRLIDGQTIESPRVVSAMGARNTVGALADDVAPGWRSGVESLASSVSYISLYLGLRGDIRRLGATSANVWIYESNDVGRIWERPTDEAAPALYVTFPSLKDPAHADPERHTAEVFAICGWQPFEAWAGSAPGRRPEAYEATKAWIGENLLAQFNKHFPQLAPAVEFHEFSTPLSQAAYVGAHRGAMYGLEMSAQRLQHRALRIRTPVRGLLLAGQDATAPGVQGAFMGGFLAAASIEPRLWSELGR